MKNIVLISVVVAVGCSVLGAQDIDPINEYYDNLDLNNVELAAYNHEAKDEGMGLYRKRAHKRKRIIRPPIRGK